MKRAIPVIAGLVLVLGLTTGCGEKQNQTGQMYADEQQTQQQDPSQKFVETSNFIGEDKAKEIALSQVDIVEEGVIFEKIELDNDDGVWRYEIEFRQGNTEYDVDIKADDGTVLRSEKDIDD